METLTVMAYEWFDKVNGNSYFSGEIFADNKLIAVMPFQYGYGNHYEYIALSTLEKNGVLKDVEYYGNGGCEALWRYCQRKKIALLCRKEENCLKRDVKRIGTQSLN